MTENDMPFGLSDTEMFFYDNAAYAHTAGASTAEHLAARAESAKRLAYADSEVKRGPYFVEVAEDPNGFDGDADYDGPVWIVSLWNVQDTYRPVLVDSLGGVCCESESDPYISVVIAEMATKLIPDWPNG